MKYLIAGGTGFIGRHLRSEVERNGDKVTVLTRGEITDGDFIRWDPLSDTSPKDVDVGSFDIVVNLSGEGIERRWTSNYKEILVKSRVRATSVLVSLINLSERKPRYFVNASAIGYYGNRESPVDEESPPGNDFLAELCVKWEGEARKIDRSVKLLIPRFGIVLGNDGGALPALKTMARYGITPKSYGSSSWKSWIGISDASRSIPFMISNGFSGSYNAVSLNPASLQEFIKGLYNSVGRKPKIHLGKRAFRLLLGEGSEFSIYGGQNVRPKRLQELGFKFKYDNLESAMRSGGV
ncbi:MAG: TIGR01777 family oxidoreductase [Thermoplasmatales archaeon]